MKTRIDEFQGLSSWRYRDDFDDDDEFWHLVKGQDRNHGPIFVLERTGSNHKKKKGVSL